MSVTTPEWLARHDAKLVASENGNSWMVYFGKELTYVLVLVPSKGNHGIKVTQTINGKQIYVQEVFPTENESLQAHFWFPLKPATPKPWHLG